VLAYDKLHYHKAMTYVDFGFLIFRKEAFAQYPAQTGFDLAVPLKHLIIQRELKAFEVSERFYEVGTEEGIRTLTEYLSDDDSL
jgi:NDP-sugar pyrophosphorylase family protein